MSARAKRLVFRGAALLALALAAPACGGGKPPAAPAFDTTQPHWEDAFEGAPEILVVVHPQAIARDKVYGPFLASLTRVLASRAQAGGARAAEVLASSEEIVFGMRRTAGGPPDAVIVVRGVRSDIDPARLADEHGAPMWRPAAPAGRAQEMTRDEASASLFVLPQRTWVVALGDARLRAREAFAHPFGRPAPIKDDRALAVVRLDGPSLVQAVPRLRARGAPLEPVGRRLDALTIALAPGTEGLRARFFYSEEGAAAFAEATLKELAAAIARQGGEKIKWLGAARVDREASTVTADVALPPQLVAGLIETTPTDLGL